MPGVWYFARRIGHGLLVIVGVSALSFVFIEAAPGEFIDELRLDPRVSDATLEAVRDRYGLERPLPEKYLRWLRSVARGEFGYSMSYEGPVGPLLWPRARNTLLLTLAATALAWTIAVPVGAWAASRQGRRTDRVLAATTTALLSVPEVLIGLGLLLLALRTGLFPTGGMVSPAFDDLPWPEQLADVVSHFVLPVTGLSLAILPAIVRHVRASLVDVLGAPFVHAARAQGIPERRLLFRCALRAAANPLISLLGLSMAALLSASLVLESVLSWPGLGPLMLQAVAARDLQLVVAAVTCSTVLLVSGTIAADALLYLADPRIRQERP
jgi:peptide/nickel transport system permease protein